MNTVEKIIDRKLGPIIRTIEKVCEEVGVTSSIPRLRVRTGGVHREGREFS